MPFKFNPFTKKLDITDVSGGGDVAIDSIIPNSGTSPVLADLNGQITLQGTGSITTVGSTNSLTPQLTGLTNHTVLVGAGTATITKVGPGLSGQVLRSGGASADPAYSTATYPATATGSGTLLRADGTNWSASTTTYPNTNAINTILYASSANVMSALATANNGALITSGTGVPSIGTVPIAAGGTNATSLSTSNGIVKYDGTRLVTSSAATLSSANQYVNTSQPACSTWLLTGIADVTGDGTTYTLIFDNEPYDQGSNYDLATGIFTSPVQGLYLVTFSVTLTGITSSHTTGTITLDTASSFNVNEELVFNPFAISTGGICSFTINTVFKLQVSGTITPKISVSGGTKVVDIQGAAGGRSRSFFSCNLLT